MQLFVGKHCGACKMLEGWLSKNNIEIEKCIAEDNMDKVNELGIKTLPALVLDDKTVIKGNETIKEYLKPEEE